MKHKWLLIGGTVVVAAFVIGVVATIATQKPSTTTDQQAGPQTAVAEACTLLTKDVATKVLGADATIGDNLPPARMDDLSVTTCTYGTPAGDSAESIQNIRTAVLLMRVPLTDAGKASNQAQFTSAKPAGTTAVTGLGDNAYWDPAVGQLNMLKKDTWIIFSLGKAKATERTLAETKVFAELIAPKY